MQVRICLLALFMVLVATEAHAISQVLLQTCSIALTIWVWIRGAVYVLAAISLALMSIQASILGRFSMERFATWGIALFVLSSVPAILAFLTYGNSALNCNLYNAGGGGPF
jgi:hypothetical protein